MGNRNLKGQIKRYEYYILAMKNKCDNVYLFHKLSDKVAADDLTSWKLAADDFLLQST